jgi:hypothetical protein
MFGPGCSLEIPHSDQWERFYVNPHERKRRRDARRIDMNWRRNHPDLAKDQGHEIQRRATERT